jgi:DNA-directed RNA polymerase alpha subunit
LHETDFTAINATIEDIGLSNRAYNVLIVNGIHSVQQLLIMASDGHRIKFLKGAGPTVANEIQQKLLKFQNTHIFKGKKSNIF